MKDYLKIIPVFVAGVLFSTIPYLPADTSGMLKVVARKNVAAGGYVLEQNHEATRTGSQLFGNATGTKYLAVKFTTPGSGYTVTKVEIPLFKSGSPTFNYTVQIWSHDAAQDDPSAQTGTFSSAGNAASALGTSNSVWSAYTGGSSALSASTIYWVVVICDAAGDGANYINWDRSSTAGHVTHDDNGTGSWTDTSFTITLHYRLYSGTP